MGISPWRTLKTVAPPSYQDSGLWEWSKSFTLPEDCRAQGFKCEVRIQGIWAPFHLSVLNTLVHQSKSGATVPSRPCPSKRMGRRGDSARRRRSDLNRECLTEAMRCTAHFLAPSSPEHLSPGGIVTLSPGFIFLHHLRVLSICFVLSTSATKALLVGPSQTWILRLALHGGTHPCVGFSSSGRPMISSIGVGGGIEV